MPVVRLVSRARVASMRVWTARASAAFVRWSPASRAGGMVSRKAAAALLACVLASSLGGALIAFGAVGHLYFDRRNLPDLGPFARFEFPTIGRIYDSNGQPLIELAHEYRQITRYEDIPPIVRDAILATEDKRFFSHNGVDYFAMPRVAGKVRVGALLRRLATGGRHDGTGARATFPQGGSTITQQLVRGVFLQRQTSQENSHQLRTVGLVAAALSAVIGARNANMVLRKREEVRLSLWLEQQMRERFGSKRRAKEEIVYLAAFRQGSFTLDTLVPDEPISVPTGRATPPKWISNYDGRFKGLIPLREALAESRNAVAVWITAQVGIDAVLRTWRSLGAQTPLQRYATTALGASEVTLLELATAYRAIASGVLAQPYVIRQIVRASDGAMNERGPRATPMLLVRIGFDDNRSLGPRETGGRLALPVFREVMLMVYRDGIVGRAPVFPNQMERRITRYLETAIAPLVESVAQGYPGHAPRSSGQASPLFLSRNRLGHSLFLVIKS